MAITSWPNGKMLINFLVKKAIKQFKTSRHVQVHRQTDRQTNGWTDIRPLSFEEKEIFNAFEVES